MSTGNETRDDYIRRAIAEVAALNEPLTYGALRDLLPDDFDLGDDEFADAIRDVPEPERVVRNTDPTPEASVTHTDPTPEARLSRGQAQHACDLAAMRLDNSRTAVSVARETCRTTLAALSKTIVAWQEQGDPLSAAERQQREVRNHLASEQAARAARGAASSGAARFVQKHMRNGPSRGAFSRAAATRLGFKMPGTGQ